MLVISIPLFRTNFTATTKLAGKVADALARPGVVEEVALNPRQDQTQSEVQTFDFSAYPADTLFLDRRTLPGPDGSTPRTSPTPTPRPRKERRRRVDPTTFEKQYNDDEIAFMNAIQNFKSRSGKMFPSHGDILRVALNLGYRKPVPEEFGVAVNDGAIAEDSNEMVGSAAPG